MTTTEPEDHGTRLAGVPAPRSFMHRAAAGLIGLLVASGVACTGERPELAAEPEETTTSTEATTTTREAPAQLQVAQVENDPIDVFDDATSSAPSRQLSAADVTSAPGIPLVFLVKARGDDRVEVYLPTEPAGSTGWVSEDDVALSSVEHRIEIDLTDRRLRVFEGDDEVLDEPAGIGPDAPGAGEGIYVRELVQPPDDDGPYGTYAYGLAGSPTVRAGLEAGEGVVGIHGSDDEDLIGTEMSTGSVAIAADVLTRLVDDLGLPLGTPVVIVS